jgi:5-methyltetrahydropteroyltriglutamate--homocysteine methyltransferase
MTGSAGSSLNAIRSDHTGGLSHPPALDAIYRRLGEGTVPEDELRAIQDQAVRDVIARQEAIGLPVVNDGEFRRLLGFQDSFGGAVTGYDSLPYGSAESVSRSAVDNARLRGEGADGPQRRIETGLSAVSGQGRAIYNRLPVRERLQLVNNLILDEYRQAAAIATRPVKVTLIGPDRVSQRFDYEHSRDVYADMDAFLADVVAIQRQMIAEVVAAGCRYIQIDEPGFTAYVDPPLLAQMRARGEDPLTNLQRSIDADNAIIEGFPGVTFAVHICRGGGGGRNGPGAHREGSYDAIAEQLFSQLNFDRFLLEYDSEAAGSFDAIRFIRPGKVAVLGLAANNGTEVEQPDYLKQRIDEASAFLPLEQLAVCPRCGLRNLDEDVQWAKLEALQRVADDVWGPPA